MARARKSATNPRPPVREIGAMAREVEVPTPGEALRGWGRALVDLLYPPVCLVCRQRLLPEETTFCLVCAAKFTPAFDWQCPRCGARGVDGAPEPGQHCRLCPPAGAPYLGIFAVTGYFAESARAVHLFKYDRRLEVGRRLAQLSAAPLAGEIAHLGGRVEMIVPVPLHWSRRLVRGFNQSLILARTLAEATGLPLRPNVLRRTRYTRRQALVPHEGRAQNVRGAFAVRSGKADLRERGVVLVDDVVTTGYTVHECARVLREAGVKEVWVACFARAGVWKPVHVDS